MLTPDSPVGSPSAPACHHAPHVATGMPRRVRVWLGLLVLSGLVSAATSSDQPAVSSCLFLGITFAQTSLLGLWTALSRWPGWCRLPICTVGVALLSTLVCAGISEWSFVIVLLLACATAVVAAVGWFARIFWKLRFAPSDSTAPEGLQFTLRHLFGWTSGMAMLAAIGRWGYRLDPRSPDDLTWLTFGLSYASVGIVALWTFLGNRVWLRLPILVVLVGFVPWLAAKTQRSGAESLFWVGTSAIQATLVSATFAIQRSAGLRLVRQ